MKKEEYFDMVLKSLLENQGSLCIYEAENIPEKIEGKIIISPAYNKLLLELGMSNSEIKQLLEILKEDGFIEFDMVNGLMYSSVWVKIKSENTIGNTVLDNTMSELVGKPNKIIITLKGKFFIQEGGYIGKHKKESKEGIMTDIDKLNALLDFFYGFRDDSNARFDWFDIRRKCKPFLKLPEVEIKRMLKKLNQDGYIELCEIQYTCYIISFEGITFKENGGYHSQKESEDVNPKFDYQEICNKLEEVLTGIKRNELATEIVYDELQEMKEASKMLDKKNWVQLLKGKLIDLAFDKAAGLTTLAASQIFFELTGTHIKQLG